MKDHLLIRGIIKEIFQIRAQALEDINQCGDGRGGQIPLDLGDKALR